MNTEKLRKLIDKSIEDVESKGWSIKPELWASYNRKCCCPLGAIAISAEGMTKDVCVGADDLIEDQVFSGNRDAMYSFADAFDGRDFDPLIHYRNYYNLGLQYRNKYKPG